MELTRTAATTRGEIAWERFGAGPPVVLVHGTPSRALVWRHVVEALRGEHEVFVFDLLGFGESERRLDQDVSVAAHAAVLAELLEGWNLGEPPALVAHDIGGAVALRAHLLGKVPVARLALVDAVVLRPWITDRTRGMQRRLDELRRSLPSKALAAEIEEHLRGATHRPLDPEVFQALFGQWAGEEGQALYLRNLARFDERHTEEFEPLLAQMPTPTLVLWGEHDAWLPVETSARIAALLANARRSVIPDAGHFCMEDRPDEVAAELRDFLA